MKKLVVLMMAMFLFGLFGGVYAGEKGPDWIPPGHRTDGGNNSQNQGQNQGQIQGQAQGQVQGQSMTNSIKVDNKINSISNATGGKANAVAQGGKGGNAVVNVTINPTPDNPDLNVSSGDTREPIALASPTSTDQTMNNKVEVKSEGVGTDPALFRQPMQTLQPTFSSLPYGSGKDANWKVLTPENIKWLPDVHDYMLRNNEYTVCKDLKPKRIYWRRGNFETSWIRHIPDGKMIRDGQEHVMVKGKDYRIVGFIGGSCEGGDSFDLHFNVAKIAMGWGADGITYIQLGKGEKQSAWSFSLFGGSAVTGMDGAGKKQLGITGGIGPSWGSSSMEDFPGVIAVVIELIK